MSRAQRVNREIFDEHDPRTLKVGAELEPRPSIADERHLTDDVRAREHRERRETLRTMLGHLAAAERELAAARAELRAVDRRTCRDLDRIRQAVARIRSRHRGDVAD